MVFKNLSVLDLWTDVASSLEGLIRDRYWYSILYQILILKEKKYHIKKVEYHIILFMI